MDSSFHSVPPEETIYGLWQLFCASGKCSPDGRLRGVFAGEFNRFDGPDFQGAEFFFNDTRCRGDIEIHCENEDWFRHGHHLDARYDCVMLHLIWSADSEQPSSVQNSKGRLIPTYAINWLPVQDAQLHPAYFCQSRPDSAVSSETVLKQLSLKRLVQKGRFLQNLAQLHGHDQALYSALLRITGSPNNKNNFELLANLLPWNTIREIAQRFKPSLVFWQKLFFCAAGLIEPTPQISILLSRGCLSAKVWKRSGQRPANAPQARLNALACFVHGFRSGRLYSDFKELFRARLPSEELLLGLFTRLCFTGTTASAKPGWGKATVCEIIGNVFLPYFYLEAVQQKSYGFAAYLEEIYYCLPCQNRYAVLAPFIKTGFDSGVKNNFMYAAQGLLYLNSHFCQQSLCRRCPLGRIIKKN